MPGCGRKNVAVYMRLARAPRAWLYCRVNHDDETAMAKQQKSLEAYAEAQGYTVAGVTLEYGSGLDIERNGLKEVFAAVKRKEFDLLLISGPDRLCRNAAKGIHFIRKLSKNGVSVVCANAPETDFLKLALWDEIADAARADRELQRV